MPDPEVTTYFLCIFPIFSSQQVSFSDIGVAKYGVFECSCCCQGQSAVYSGGERNRQSMFLSEHPCLFCEEKGQFINQIDRQFSLFDSFAGEKPLNSKLIKIEIRIRCEKKNVGIGSQDARKIFYWTFPITFAVEKTVAVF